MVVFKFYNRLKIVVILFYFYFLKIIFEISTLKQFKNIKKYILNKN
jgi:hypothetical protein